MNNSNRIILGLTALLVPGPAFGQPVVVEMLPTATVSYADLDLTSPRGVAALNGRVRRAAESLCRNPGVVGVAARLAERSCVAFAQGHAEAQIETAIAQAGNERFAARGTIIVPGR